MPTRASVYNMRKKKRAPSFLMHGGLPVIGMCCQSSACLSMSCGRMFLLAVLAKFVSEQGASRKPATGLRCTRTRYSLISFGMGH